VAVGVGGGGLTGTNRTRPSGMVKTITNTAPMPSHPGVVGVTLRWVPNATMALRKSSLYAGGNGGGVLNRAPGDRQGIRSESLRR